MKNWKMFWDQYRVRETDNINDLFFQVGKTINGEAISPNVFSDMIGDIRLKLELDSNDVVLEMCCGNGLLSRPLSVFVKKLYAFDFTQRLIEIAKEHNQETNILYSVGDAKGKLDDIFDFEFKPNKYLMNDSLAYFDISDLSSILEQINGPFSFYITGVPSEDLKFNFYDTEERVKRYNELKELGDEYNDGLGLWWNPESFLNLGVKFKLDVFIERQPPHVSNFRINVLFKSKA